MKILLANQKGGVGKTSLAILLANYIKYKLNKTVIGLDFDFQASFFNQWETDLKVIGSDDPYKVSKVPLVDAKVTSSRLNQFPNEFFILDSPGKRDDKNLLELYSSVDLLICPFSYERKNFESTFSFSRIVRHVNPDLKILYVPNRVKSTAKYSIKSKVREALNKFGDVYAEDISDRVCMERINFFTTTKEQVEVTEGLFKYINSHYLLSK